jgi:hypothetical protein
LINGAIGKMNGAEFESGLKGGSDFYNERIGTCLPAGRR